MLAWKIFLTYTFFHLRNPCYPHKLKQAQIIFKLTNSSQEKWDRRMIESFELVKKICKSRIIFNRKLSPPPLTYYLFSIYFLSFSAHPLCTWECDISSFFWQFPTHKTYKIPTITSCSVINFHKYEMSHTFLVTLKSIK